MTVAHLWKIEVRMYAGRVGLLSFLALMVCAAPMLAFLTVAVAGGALTGPERAELVDIGHQLGLLGTGLGTVGFLLAGAAATLFDRRSGTWTFGLAAQLPRREWVAAKLLAALTVCFALVLAAAVVAVGLSLGVSGEVTVRSWGSLAQGVGSVVVAVLWWTVVGWGLGLAAGSWAVVGGIAFVVNALSPLIARLGDGASPWNLLPPVGTSSLAGAYGQPVSGALVGFVVVGALVACSGLTTAVLIAGGPRRAMVRT